MTSLMPRTDHYFANITGETLEAQRETNVISSYYGWNQNPQQVPDARRTAAGRNPSSTSWQGHSWDEAQEGFSQHRESGSGRGMHHRSPALPLSMLTPT